MLLIFRIFCYESHISLTSFCLWHKNVHLRQIGAVLNLGYSVVCECVGYRRVVWLSVVVKLGTFRKSVLPTPFIDFFPHIDLLPIKHTNETVVTFFVKADPHHFCLVDEV